MSKLLILFGVSVFLGSPSPIAAQTLGGCNIFPANNVWNTAIDKLPVDANSAAYVTTIGAARGLHPDFSSAGGGIGYTIVPGTQLKVPVVFGAGLTESEPGPYPIPPTAPVEPGDGHVLVLENTNCILYELYQGVLQTNGSWTANSGAIFPLTSNQLRPAGWTSTDAAGFAVLPGLVRYDEVAAGAINHALRMTAPQTRNQYIWPARHEASTLTGTQYPPMGQRFRLKASFNISTYTADVQVILTALKKYGALVADNGSSWYLTGAPDPRWNDSTLHALGQVLGSNMEAVDESSLMADPNSAAVAGSTTPTYAVRVNAGGPSVVDSSGQTWSADEDYAGGSIWSVSNAITGTTAPALYQTCRYGSSFSYPVQAPNGTYTVNLKFAELYETAAGLRMFNVAINGSTVLTNFDIFAQAGAAFKAVDKGFPVTVTNGQINIQFTSGNANQPMINAIEIVGTPNATFSAIQVNAGGPSVVDPAGHTWSSDENFSGGYEWSTAHAITGTTSPVLYQTCRYGSSFSYQFTVPNGSHTVTLKFAEPYLTAAGQRQFNVAINGSTVLTNFDIFAQAGGEFVAVDKGFPVTVTNGTITIQFSSGAANMPMVSGIAIQ